MAIRLLVDRFGYQLNEQTHAANCHSLRAAGGVANRFFYTSETRCHRRAGIVCVDGSMGVERFSCAGYVDSTGRLRLVDGGDDGLINLDFSRSVAINAVARNEPPLVALRIYSRGTLSDYDSPGSGRSMRCTGHDPGVGRVGGTAAESTGVDSGVST